MLNLEFFTKPVKMTSDRPIIGNYTRDENEFARSNDLDCAKLCEANEALFRISRKYFSVSIVRLFGTVAFCVSSTFSELDCKFSTLNIRTWGDDGLHQIHSPWMTEDVRWSSWFIRAEIYNTLRTCLKSAEQKRSRDFSYPEFYSDNNYSEKIRFNR